MFKKLLSNLPFNPSLINQVSFYTQRLKRETAIRRMGFIFIALAMIVQVVAVMSPPQSSVSASPNNDLINGGFGSHYEALSDCVNNVQGYRDILAHFNISCDNLAHGSVVSLNSRDYNGQLFSMGRIAYGKAGETPVNVNGTTFFLRYLWSWDGASTSTYQAIRGTGSDGKPFFLLFDCGNLVLVGLPSTPPPAPKPVCTTAEGAWYQGWGFWYRSPDGDVNKAIQPIATTNPCVPKPPKPVCVVNGVSWYQGWGFWYKSPDGDVNKAILPVATTNPCVSNPPAPPKCPYDSSLPASDTRCKPCPAMQTSGDKTACLVFSKKASNTTANVADANNTTAKPGDVILYSLFIKNTGKVDIDNFPFQENISDVLDYADVVNLNGATKDANSNLSWGTVKIKAGQTITRQFSVKVKNPIPSTPISSSDPGHFDLTMTNVYGNTINIKLPGSVTKTTEVVTNTLPNTGPGTTIAVGFGVTMIVGYFFARSRLMAKELAIVKADYASGDI